MAVPCILASTTSHKREPLLPTLEVFARLGLVDIDLNLHHFIEGGEPIEGVLEAADRHGLRIPVASGGWCDFFHRAPDVEGTFASIDRQVALIRQLGIRHLRLFFGRLSYEHYSPQALQTIRANLLRLSDAYPDLALMFENHDGASGHPEVCREILMAVDRPNIRMNFDPINFEHVGVDGLQALRLVGPLVGHVHLKGLDADEFCEFGAGRVDLAPALAALAAQDYRGAFTVEYEGSFDRTLRLYLGVQRARAVASETWGGARPTR